jgi:hypothetical protein
MNLLQCSSCLFYEQSKRSQPTCSSCFPVRGETSTGAVCGGFFHWSKESSQTPDWSKKADAIATIVGMGKN